MCVRFGVNERMKDATVRRTSTEEGTIACTLSRLNIAPRDPALHPPNSSRCPAWLPSPLFDTSSDSVAWMMRCPRKLKPNELSAAPTSPAQASEEQYAK